MPIDYLGFSDNPENREVKSVRTVRFERKQKPTEKNPDPQADEVSMQFEATADLGNGVPGVVGFATVRGALYAIGLSGHDLQWCVTEVEREIDKARARQHG